MPMQTTPSPYLIVTRFASMASVSVGAMVLIGWLFNIGWLMSVLPGFVSMKPNTALSFVLFGVALGSWLEARGRVRYLSSALALIVTVVGIMTMMQYVFGWNFRIDELIIKDFNPRQTEFPGRMAPSTALNFILLGSALLSLHRRTVSPLISQILSSLVLFNSILALIGYSYGVHALTQVFSYTSVALHTALMFAVLGLGMFIARPNEGFAKVVTGDSIGSLVARRILPLAVLIPFFLGFLRVKGEQAGYYNTEFGVAVFATVTIIVFTILILFNARLLNRADADRRYIEAQVKESEEFKEAVLSTAQFGITVVDERGTLLYLNKYMRELAGGDVLGKHCWMVYRDDKTQCCDCPLHESITINGMKTIEAHGVFGDRRFEVSHIGMMSNGKNVLLEVFRDVTELRRSQELLRKSEARYYDLYQNAPDMYLSVEMKGGTVVDCNEALIRSLGYTREEFLGRSIFAFYDEACHHEAKRALAEFKATGDIRDKELKVRRNDGSTLDVLLSATAVRDQDGTIVQSRSVWRDITKRKEAENRLRESEERFQFMSRATSDVMYDWNITSGQLWFNENLTTVFKMEDHHSNVTLDWWGDHIHPSDRNGIFESLQVVQEGNQSMWEAEYRFLRGDGSYAEVYDRGYFVRDNTGGAVRMIGSMMDISARKKAELELRTSRDRLAESQRLAHIGNWEISLETGILTWSEELYRIYGVDPKIFLPTQSSFLDLIHPDDRSEMGEWIAALLSNQKPDELIFRRILPDGRARHIVGQGELQGGEDGKPKRAVGTAQDITERIHAEEALQLSENRYSSIFQLVPVSIWEEDWSSVIAMVSALQKKGITDYTRYFKEHPEFVLRALEKVKILDVNDATLGIFKARSKQEMLSSLATVFATPDTLPGFEAELVALGTGKLLFETEMALRTVEKDLIHVLLTMTFPPPGNDSGIVLVSLMDITSRKRTVEALAMSNERFLLATEGAGLGIWNWNIVTGELVWSEQCKALFGVAPDETMSYERFREALHPDDRERTDRAVRNSLDNHKDYDIEYRSLWPDGSIRWLSAKGRGYYDATGKAVRMEGVVSDISARKQAEKELETYQNQLEQHVTERTAQLQAANGELEAFAYSVSHDLRAPLRSIDGFSQALLEDYADRLDDEGKSNLRRVRAASQRMAQLIDDLLTISRVTRAEINLQKVSLSALAEQVADELQKQDRRRRVEFRIQPGLYVDADARLMRVVLENLLGNSWKFTSKHPSARIEVGQTEKNGKKAFFVRDDGAGFDMQYADKLFGAFQRLHAIDDFPGTGIGLASVQRILRRHEGDIWAEGVVECGATMFFTLG